MIGSDLAPGRCRREHRCRIRISRSTRRGAGDLCLCGDVLRAAGGNGRSRRASSLNRGVELCEVARSAEAIEVLTDALAPSSKPTATDSTRHSAVRISPRRGCRPVGTSKRSSASMPAAAALRRARSHHRLAAGRARSRRLSRVARPRRRGARSLRRTASSRWNGPGCDATSARLISDAGTVLARSGSTSDARAAFRDARAAFEATGDRTMLARTCLAAAGGRARSARRSRTAIDLLSAGERPGGVRGGTARRCTSARGGRPRPSRRPASLGRYHLIEVPAGPRLHVAAASPRRTVGPTSR